MTKRRGELGERTLSATDQAQAGAAALARALDHAGPHEAIEAIEALRAWIGGTAVRVILGFSSVEREDFEL